MEIPTSLQLAKVDLSSLAEVARKAARMRRQGWQDEAATIELVALRRVVRENGLTPQETLRILREVRAPFPSPGGPDYA